MQVEPDAYKMSSGEVTEADTSYRQLIDHVKGRISSIFGGVSRSRRTRATSTSTGGTGGSGGGGGDP